jgi:hypothetical protein
LTKEKFVAGLQLIRSLFAAYLKFDKRVAGAVRDKI